MCVITYNAANIQCMLDNNGIQTLCKLFAAPFTALGSMVGMNIAMLCKDTPRIKNIVCSRYRERN